MAAEACPNCGSTETVRHSPDAGLKPNWLHCNGCARCAPTDVPKRSGRSQDKPVEGKDEAGDQDVSTHDAGKSAEDEAK